MAKIMDELRSTPLWVKVSLIIVIVLALLFVILHLTSNSLGGPGGHTPPSSVEPVVQRL